MSTKPTADDEARARETTEDDVLDWYNEARAKAVDATLAEFKAKYPQQAATLEQFEEFLDRCEEPPKGDRKMFPPIPTELAMMNSAFVEAEGESSLDMLLFCPQCGEQHIDEPQPEKDWTNPPHKSHECQSCRVIWRPSDKPTNGVLAIASRGGADTHSARPRYFATAKDFNDALTQSRQRAIEVEAPDDARLTEIRETLSASDSYLVAHAREDIPYLLSLVEGKS